ncbi:MAG: hypothetical protein JKY34_12720 [Kordiimonadaceae bacterium]|nr:hypothetical protein [Kordiimonadaceae bacterium]
MPKEKPNNIVPLRPEGPLKPASGGDASVSIGIGLDVDENDPSTIILRMPDGSIERYSLLED